MSKRVLAGAIGAIAGVSLLAGCGSSGDGASGDDDSGEVKFAASCATAYKSDSNARVYKLSPSGTFEDQIDNGIIKDSDNVTPIRVMEKSQRDELLIGFREMDALYKPVLAPSASKVNLEMLRIVVYGDSVNASASGADDGKLTGQACVMFGDREYWANIRKGNPIPYRDGDIDPISVK